MQQSQKKNKKQSNSTFKKVAEKNLIENDKFQKSMRT